MPPSETSQLAQWAGRIRQGEDPSAAARAVRRDLARDAYEVSARYHDRALKARIRGDMPAAVHWSKAARREWLRAEEMETHG